MVHSRSSHRERSRWVFGFSFAKSVGRARPHQLSVGDGFLSPEAYELCYHRQTV